MRGFGPRIVVIGSIVAGLLSACGNNTTSANVSTSTPQSTRATIAPVVVTVGIKTIPKLGKVLVDRRGFVLYLNTREKGAKIVCTGKCAAVWPSLALPRGALLRAGSGIKASLVGRVRRPDGTVEVAYNKWPLHMYAGDTAPGIAGGQGIGGIWFAVTPAGGAAGKSSSTTAGTTTSPTRHATTSPKPTTSPSPMPSPKPSPTPTCLYPPCY